MACRAEAVEGTSKPDHGEGGGMGHGNSEKLKVASSQYSVETPVEVDAVQPCWPLATDLEPAEVTRRGGIMSRGSHAEESRRGDRRRHSAVHQVAR